MSSSIDSATKEITLILSTTAIYHCVYCESMFEVAKNGYPVYKCPCCLSPYGKCNSIGFDPLDKKY